MLARRGPDGEGLYRWNGTTFGHRRLSIFDLSDAGRQPMLSEDGQVGVVFNGAIYNFLDLRRELEQAGFPFRSQTDTEVLVNGYLHWGFDDLVSRLRGMFAIGLWDNRNRVLYLVRDRLGVKPLIWAKYGNGIAFASSVRALRNGMDTSAGIDPQAVAEYLEFGYITESRTIYQGLFKLPAATILEWRDGQIRQREYWRPPSPGEAEPSFERAVEETTARLLEAVRLRLAADVPVGVLLSGGIDSSLVCWAISKLGANIRAFTVGTPGDPWDETSDAVTTARELGIDHQVLPLSDGEAPDLGEMITAYGEPFACASALGMLAVSKAVRASAKVLLTGDGGDDVFLGYPEHKNFWMAQRIARKLPSAAGRIWPAVRGVFPGSGALGRAAHFLDYTTGGLGAVTQIHDGLPGYNGLLGERLRQVTIAARRIPRSFASAQDLMKEFLDYDRRGRFVAEYMTKVDGATMHHALEARSPFLDQELWNYAAALPLEIRLRGGVLKAILRAIAERALGARVARGPKRGFGIPVQRWLARKWRPAFENSLRDSLLEKEGYIRAGAVSEKLKSCAAAGWAPNQLWYLFVLEAWLRREIEAPAALR